MMNPRIMWGLLSATLALSVGCGSDDNTGSNGGGGDSGVDNDAGGGDSGNGGTGNIGNSPNGGDSGVSGNSGNGNDEDAGDSGTPPSDDCPAIADREVEEISGEIDADTTWTCDKLYLLTDLSYVVGDSVLTIGPGTVVQGDTGTALVITRGSQIITQGTASDPVVMTSSLDVGQRQAGDWGGLVLLGAAPINITGGESQIEGIDATEGRGAYGGLDETSNCGHIKYTRVEFAGFELSIDNELNGITLGGCGSDTLLEYVQVHRGLDDGIELFGGSANLKHIVITAADDDGLDWDQGYSGNVQFVAIQQDPDVAGSADPSGIEADNNRDSLDAEPRSMPTLYNLTVLGSLGANHSGGNASSNAAVLRRGTWGTIRNAIFMDWPSTVDVRDIPTVAGTMENPAALAVTNSLFFNNGADGMTHFYDETVSPDIDNDDDSFAEPTYFAGAAQDNVFDEDPELGDAASVTAPDFVPASGSPAATGAATPTGAFFDATAEYIGAFEPGGTDWSAGWTSYPAD